MHKKTTILILFFSIAIHSLHGMEADLSVSQVSSLDLLPHEITDLIVYRLVPSKDQLDPEVHYKAVKSMVNFLSTSHKYSEFEATAIKALKERYTPRYLSRTLVPYAINSHDFRVSKILIEAGGIPNLCGFLTDNGNCLHKEHNLRRLRLYAQLIKLIHKNGRSIEDIIECNSSTACEKMVTRPGKKLYYHVESPPKKFTIIPIKVFFNAIQDDQKVVEAIFCNKTSTCSNELINAVTTYSPKIVKIILQSISSYPQLVKKLLDDQDAPNFSTNALMRAINLGNKKIIRMLLETGHRVQSIHLTQKTEDGRSALDCADDEATKELINEYLHK